MNRKRRDYTGQRFGRRLVLSLSHYNNSNKAIWNVKCDCGLESTADNQTLRRNSPCRNCSPRLKSLRPHRRKRPFEALYNTWTNKAIKKGRSVEISYEQFLEFTKVHNCHYCNGPVFWLEYNVKGEKRTHASNLDRKDSNKGYTVDNTVVCCLRCNKAKLDHFTYKEWVELGKIIKSWEK